MSGSEGKRWLAGYRIAITRALSQAEEMAAAVQSFGGVARCYPLICIEPPSERRSLIEAASGVYDTLVFTSVNGVQAYHQALLQEKRTSSLPVVCVGAKTAEKAVELGFTLYGTPQSFAAEHITPLLLELRDRVAHPLRVLLVRGNLADRGLPAILTRMGCIVADVIGYETKATEEGRKLVADMARGEVNTVTFLSGSAVHVFLDALAAEQRLSAEQAAKQYLFASIGPKTTQIMTAVGLHPKVTARVATGERLIADLAAYAKTHRLT